MTSIPMLADDAARDRRRVFRFSSRDGWLFGAAVAQGISLAASIPLLASRGVAAYAAFASILGVATVWGSNTVSHNHLHTPLFVRRAHNRAFAAYLSLVLGVPQTIWRARHLHHHAGDPAGRGPNIRLGAQGALEIALIASSWIAMLAFSPRFFLLAYAPGYLLGMALSSAQGHYEHTKGPEGVSHYGRLHNALWFNDGYHVEHHARPQEHWSRLPALRRRGVGYESPYPPLLRFVEGVVENANLVQASVLGVLERWVIGSALLQRFVVDCHAEAIRALLPALSKRRLDRIAVVGGGLFPRTALALRRVLPSSQIVIVDVSARNIECAREHLENKGIHGAQFVEAAFSARSRPTIGDVDLWIIPLAFVGDRDALYEPHATPMLVHDWIWRRRGASGAIISLLLLKRLNLVS